jgi:hypothetical protein
MKKPLEYLLQRIHHIALKYQQLDTISGSNFNVFKVLNITSDEVRLHSSFLAELLNPKGSHGQGSIFLELFVKEIGVKEFECTTAVVEVEKYIGPKTETTGGRIDIYIQNKDNNNITIENKIYAKDQDNQLLRYYNYSKKNLFYLNLFGDDPSESSFGHLNIDTDFKIISYQEHILYWLQSCKKEAVDHPLLREGIAHYINLIKTLVGKSNNHVMEQEIKNMIVSSSQNLRNAILLEKSMNSVKIDIQWRFWEQLRQSLREHTKPSDFSFVEEKSVSIDNVTSFYEKSRYRDKYFGLWYLIFKKDGVTVHYGIEIGHEIYYGFTLERNGAGGIANSDENSEYKQMVENLSEEYINNQYWLGYKHPNKRLDFRNFDSDAVIELADSKKMTQTINEIVEESVAHMIELRKKLDAYK